MDEKVVKFDDTEIEEFEFHQYRSPITIHNIGLINFGKQDFRYFIGYKGSEKNQAFMYI